MLKKNQLQKMWLKKQKKKNSMYSVINETSLIFPDIADRMLDYCSLQPDIDETKVKAACLVAQRLDIREVIGKNNFTRCYTNETDADSQLRELLIPALCYFTYSRLLRLFPGTFTDSGYVIEKDASDKNVTKNTAHDYADTGTVFLKDVLEFLENENPTINNDEGAQKKLTKRIRVFGGVESR